MFEEGFYKILFSIHNNNIKNSIAYVKLFSDLELETYNNIVYNKYNLYTTSLVRFISKRRINLISSLRQRN